MFQFSGIRKPPPGIVFDSDFGSSIDSVLALAMLHGLEGKTALRIAALSINSPDLQAAQLCDVIEKFYASATTGMAAAFFQGLSIGLALDQRPPTKSLRVAAMLAKQDSAGKPVYTPRIQKANDTAIPEALIRNALTAQYDENAVVVLSGPATNLARLLSLAGAKELVRQKVRVLVVAGGSFGAEQGQNAGAASLLTDLPAAQKLFAEWPTPIVACGREVGTSIPFPGASVETDFSYASNHPVADAYRAQGTMPYDAPASAAAAVLYAARPQEGYFDVSAPGTMTVGSDGKIRFAPALNGSHRYLVLKPTEKERIVKAYVELASAKPVPRSFRRPVQEDVKEPPAKPANEKQEAPPQ